MTDNIKPNYYQLADGKDLMDHLSEMFSTDEFVGFLKGNIFKYITRYQNKNGLEDLKKAKVYLDRLIDLENPELPEAGEMKKKIIGWIGGK